ncbi:MAG: polysaccharide deacetylase family protein [bacterium]
MRTQNGWKWLAMVLVLVALLTAGMANASQPEAMITFTFDDGARPIYDNALPILAERGMRAVFFGETGPLNAGESWVITWDEVRKLQNVYGWEIGSHSITHPYLTQVTDEQLTQELQGSKADFAAQGINVRGFATPYGDWDTRVMSAITKYYEWNRDAWGGANSWPYDVYHITVREPTNTTPAEEVRGWIDEAIANQQWLVLLLHGVVIGTPQPYQYGVNDFKKSVDYVAASGIKVVTISEALGLEPIDPPQPPGPAGNLVQNPSFEDGLDGWYTNSRFVQIVTDSIGNMVRIIGGRGHRLISSSEIPVSAGKEYLLSFSQWIEKYRRGGAAVWIDEFRVDGEWVSGTFLGGTYNNFAGTKEYAYKVPPGVDSVSIELYTEEGSKLTAYFDDVSLTLKK